MRCHWVFLCFILLLSGGASGQQCLDLEDYPHLRKWCREYSTISMAVENGVVYTGHYPSTLSAHYSSVAGEMELIGQIDGVGDTYRLLVEGGTAFLTHSGSVTLVDVSKPDSMSIVGELPVDDYIPGNPLIVGETMFLRVGNRGFRIFDISDLSEPTEVHSLNFAGNVTGMAIEGEVLYVFSIAPELDYTPLLSRYDISNPEMPELIVSHELPGLGNDAQFDVKVNGGLIYLSGNRTFFVVNALNQDEAAICGQFTKERYSNGFVVFGNQIYLLQNRNIFVYEATFSSGVHSVHTFAFPQEIEAVEVVGGELYLATSLGVLVFDQGSDWAPSPVETYRSGPILECIQVEGDRLFARDGMGVVWVNSIDEDGQLAILSNCQGVDFGSRGIFPIGSTLVSFREDRLQCFDFSDLTNPVAGALKYLSFSQLARLGDRVALGSGMEIMILDVSNVQMPSVIHRFQPEDTFNSIAAAGYSLFTASDRGQIKYYDCSVYDVPRLVSDYNSVHSSVSGLFAHGTLLFVACGYHGVEVVDFSDPANPAHVTNISVPGRIERVWVEGDLAYVVSAEANTVVLDISEIGSPRIVGQRTQLHHSSQKRTFTRNGNILDAFVKPCGLSVEMVASPREGLGEVQFRDFSSGQPSEWRWDFGDGQVSTNPNPVHNYQHPGVYNVRLEISDGTTTRTRTFPEHIKVLPAEIVPDFACSQYSGEVPLSVDFLDLTTGANVDSLLWDFGDGHFSREQHPSHQFDRSWEYDVTLTAYDGSQVATKTRTLSPRTRAPVIWNISDVPDDQGGRVYIDVLASSGDYDNNPVSLYNIQRFDEGDWVSVGMGLGYGQNRYRFEVPTLADSTGADPGLNEFRVLANIRFTLYASESCWGYSVDNLAPLPPEDFRLVRGEGGDVLNWQPSSSEDVTRYRIYADVKVEFTPTPDRLVGETGGTSWVHENPTEGLNYRITALDESGNESPGTAPGIEEGDAPGLIEAQVLHPSYPNPFNSGTIIQFEIPQPGTEVDVSIYDVSGRLIMNLDSGYVPAGIHVRTWNGEDENGRDIPSGVYFLKLQSPRFQSCQKITLVR